jgi:hypothetical protein
MKHKFLLCVDNEGYEASLEVRKLYEKIPDKEADRHNQVRIIDESEEDYLYPSKFSASVRLPMQTKNRIVKKAAISSSNPTASFIESWIKTSTFC